MDDETKRAILEEARLNLAQSNQSNDWEAWLDARISARLEQERALIIEACGTAIGEMLNEQRQKHKVELADEIRKLWAIITELQGTMRALDRTIAATTNLPPSSSSLQPRRDN